MVNELYARLTTVSPTGVELTGQNYQLFSLHKCLLVNYRTLFPKELEHLCGDMLTKADIDPTTRPWQLSMEDFDRLCTIYAMYCHQYPGLLDYYYRDREPNLACLDNSDTV